MRLALEHRSGWLGCSVSPACLKSRSLLLVRQQQKCESRRNNGNGHIRSGAGVVMAAVVSGAETEALEPSTSEKKRSGRQGGLQKSKRVVLVRHGQSTWNESGRIQGSSDTSILTRRGEGQAETSRQMLLADSFDVCFHSPLSRAKRTAEIIWDARKEEDMVPLIDLREIDLYAFQGLFKEQGKERFGEAYKKWQKDPVNFEIDDHYPVRELWERAGNCWDSILSSNGSSVLVVAHNAVNQALVATATGLGPEYFRQLLQSNCGVSVLDFTPRRGTNGSTSSVCLDRLNQTPGPPLLRGKSAGRSSQIRILLVCHGATDSTFKKRFPISDVEPMNMLGTIQSGKTAELLLDTTVDGLISSPNPCALTTADAIAQIQEAAECLGGDCIARYVEVTQLEDLRDLNWGSWKGMPKEEVVADRWQDQFSQSSIPGGETMDEFWQRAGQAWQAVLSQVDNLQTESSEKTVVVVSHEVLHAAMLCHCLGLDQSYFPSFRLDTSSLSVIEFPDGVSGKGIVRCLNYTAHLGRWAVPVTKPVAEEEEF